MIERFDLPKDLLSRLPTLAAFLRDRDRALAEGFSYDRLLEEMDSAIAVVDSQSPPTSTTWSGRCWIHPEARIKENVVIEGPCIVCKGAQVGPKAYLGAAHK